jgi:hypothetical protein
VLDDLPPFMTVEQAAEVLQLGRSKTYELTVEWERSGGSRGCRSCGSAARNGSLGSGSPGSSNRRCVTRRPPERISLMMLGSAAPWVRRIVGPVAWAVLEVLAEHSERNRERTVSARSVRGLAAELGLANDTVARALRRLGDAGLLHHESEREASGRFASGRYVLTLPPDVIDVATDLEDPSLSKSAAKPRVRPSSGEQLALLAEG